MLKLLLAPLLILMSLLLLPFSALAQETLTLPLTTSYTSGDGSLSFRYPGGWTAADTGVTAALGTSEAAFTSGDLPSGEIRAAIYAAPTDSLPGLEAGAPLTAVLAIVTNEAAQAECEPFTSGEAHEVNGRAILRADQQCPGVENMLLVIDLGGDIVGFIGASARSGSMEQFAPTLLEIAGTLEYAAPAAPAAVEADSPDELTGEFTSADGTISMRYPANWHIEESGDVIGITDGEGAIFPNPTQGQLIVYLVIDQLPDTSMLNLNALLQGIINANPPPVPYGEPETFQIGSFRAIRARMESQQIDSLLIVVDLGENRVAVLNALHYPGELAALESALYSTIATLAVGDAFQSPFEPQEAESAEVPAQDVSANEGMERFNSEDTGYAFDYPAGWFVSGEAMEGFAIFVISSVETIEEGPPQPGSPYALLQIVTLTEGDLQQLPANPDSQPLALLEQMRAETGAPFSEPVSVSLDGREAGRMDLPSADFDSTAMLVFVTKDRFALLTLFSAPGEIADLIPTFTAVLESVTFGDEGVLEGESVQASTPVPVEPTPLPEPTAVIIVAPLSLDLSETYTSEDGTLTLGYPAGWSLETANNLLTLQNVEELSLETTDSGLEIVQGQYRIIIGIEADGEALPDIFTRETTNIDADSPEPMVFGEHEAVGGAIDMRVMSGTLYVVDLGGGQIAIVTAIHAPGEREQLEPLVEAIIDSLQAGTAT